MKQIKILVARHNNQLEDKINSFLHEISSNNWELISIYHFSATDTFTTCSEYEARILYENHNGTN